MEKYRQEVKAWLEQNPLRQWRKKNKLFLKDIGSAVNAGYHSVFRWENGMSEPGETQMKDLIRITGIGNLQKQYREWIKKRPILK